MEIRKINKSLLFIAYRCIPPLLILFLIFNTALAKEKHIIAITQIVEHPSLEQAKKGIIDELSNQGFVIGKNLQIIDKNAQGQISNAVLIAKQFIAQKPDVIIPISTPSAQSLISSLKSNDVAIPIVFSSVTDPVAIGLTSNLNIPIENITGVMDSPLIKEEIQLIKALLPNIKKLGLLYSSGEANSAATIALLKIELAKEKLEYIEVNIVNSAQVSQGFLSLVSEVDAIYIPSDNIIFSAMAKLVQLSRAHKLPLFSSDPDSVKSGVTACIGYSQYIIGINAGELVAKMLRGERNILIKKPEIAEIFINKLSAQIMNINIDNKILGINPKIVE